MFQSIRLTTTTSFAQDSLARSMARRIVWSPLLAAATILFLLAAASNALAGSATWNLNPTNGDWDTAANWTPATVPNGPADTATFGVSNTSAVSLSAATEVRTIVFNSGASPFTITAGPAFALNISNTINGIGIINHSGLTQTFVSAAGGGSVHFMNGANAGDQNTFIGTGGTVSHGFGGSVLFSDYSDAGNSTFINNGGSANGASGGEVQFDNVSGAENGTFINNGGTANGALGGVTSFIATAFANESTLIANGGSGGGKGGSIMVSSFVNGGTARVEVFADGNLDISFYSGSLGVTFGSIEGDGFVFLGAKKLTVGSNNLSTTFSGTMQDGGLGGGIGGSVTKIGTGTLTLTHANTYTGNTTVKSGNLVVNNMSGSGTGSGAVQVNAGILGGRGTIAGAVTVGTGSGNSAILAPGRRGGRPGNPLTIQSTLTFKSDATYKADLNSLYVIADEVIVNGVTIENGALFSLLDAGQGVLTLFTVFTVIDNTSATPIAGTFTNLADGSIFTLGNNTFLANYEGGDGNDLTLTVVPPPP